MALIRNRRNFRGWDANLEEYNDPEEYLTDSHERSDEIPPTYVAASAEELPALSAKSNRIQMLGEDRSLWHAPFFVDTRHWIRTELPEAWQQAPEMKGLRVSSRMHLRLFPYGLLVAYLCVSIGFPRDWAAARAIRLLRTLSGAEPKGNRASFRMAGVFEGDASSFLAQVAAAVKGSLLRIPREGDLVDGGESRILSVAVEGLESDDKLATGLLVLEPDYEKLGDRFTSRAGLYGKWQSDLVIATKRSMLISTSPLRAGPRARLRWTWNLVAVMELARAQQAIVPYLTRTARMTLDDRQLDGTKTARLDRGLRLLDHLEVAHESLDPHHRKWYYSCRDTLGLQDSFDAASEVRGRLRSRLDFSELRTVLHGLSSAKSVIIKVSGQSQVGNINLGTQIGKIESELNAVQVPMGNELVAALAELARGIHDAVDLEPDAKQHLLDLLGRLSRRAATPPDPDLLDLVSRVPRHAATALDTDVDPNEANQIIESLEEGLAKSAECAQLFETWGDTIRRFFAVPLASR